MRNRADMRNKITLQYFTGSTIENGLEIPNYVDGITVWAACEPLKGREFFEAMAVQSEISMRFKIWYMSGITSKKTRVKYGIYTDEKGISRHRIWEVLAVIDPEEKHRELHLMCKVVE